VVKIYAIGTPKGARDSMYLSEVVIRNFRQFGSPEQPFRLELQPGVTALVGENDSGKTAVIDAIRYALLTRNLSRSLRHGLVTLFV
jgi:predicted ATP-dependent endonuclease of OLD family